MREVFLRISDRSNFYFRNVSDDGSEMEIQNQYSGIIVRNSTVRRTVRGVILYDDDGSGYTSRIVFSDRTRSGFEKNRYTIKNFRW